MTEIKNIFNTGNTTPNERNIRQTFKSHIAVTLDKALKFDVSSLKLNYVSPNMNVRRAKFNLKVTSNLVRGTNV